MMAMNAGTAWPRAAPSRASRPLYGQAHAAEVPERGAHVRVAMGAILGAPELAVLRERPSADQGRCSRMLKADQDDNGRNRATGIRGRRDPGGPARGAGAGSSTIGGDAEAASTRRGRSTASGPRAPTSTTARCPRLATGASPRTAPGPVLRRQPRVRPKNVGFAIRQERGHARFDTTKPGNLTPATTRIRPKGGGPPTSSPRPSGWRSWST